MTAGIEETLTEMNNCIKLLVTDDLNLFNEEPSTVTSSSRPEDTSEQPCCSKDLSHEQSRETTQKKSEKEDKDQCSDDSDMEKGPDEDAFLRSTGLMSHKYQLELSVATGTSSLLVEFSSSTAHNRSADM